MIDAQTMFLKTGAVLSDLDFITTIVERNYADAPSVVGVKVNGQSVGFSLVDLTTLNYAVPIKTDIASVNIIVYEVATLNESGGDPVITEDVRPLPNPSFLEDPYSNESLDIFFDVSSIMLRLATPASAEEVLINGASTPFFTLDASHIVAALPANLNELLSVDVIVGADFQNDRTFFAYKVDLFSTVTGPRKLISQFNKLILTSVGSDIFEPTLGGDLQNWVGSKHSLANKNSAIILANINILRTSLYMQSYQMLRGVPRDETIAHAEVLDYSADWHDPTNGEMSLRIVSLGGISSMFNAYIEKAKSLVSEATANVETITGVDLSAKSDS